MVNSTMDRPANRKDWSNRLIYCTTIIWPTLVVTLMQMMIFFFLMFNKNSIGLFFCQLRYFIGHTMIIQEQIQRLEKLL